MPSGNKPLPEPMSTQICVAIWLTRAQWVNTLGPKMKWLTFYRQHFQMYFLELNCLNFEYIFIEVCSWVSYRPNIYTGSGNGLVPSGNKLLPEPMLCEIPDILLQHPKASSSNEPTLWWLTQESDNLQHCNTYIFTKTSKHNSKNQCI